MLENGLRIMTGLCQTSHRSQLDYAQDLSKMEVTNPSGVIVSAIWGIRHCDLKSRTFEGEGMGIDYRPWQKYSRQVYGLKPGEKMPAPPVTKGARWAAKIQEKTELVIGLEVMDPNHVALFAGFIQPGMGLFWTPSILSEGHTIQMISQKVGEMGCMLGIKNPKFYHGNPHEERLEEMLVLAKAWAGLGTYALAVKNLPTEIINIERGVLTQFMGDYRNVPVEKTATLTQKLLFEEIVKRRLQKKTKLGRGKDISHDNGPKRRDKIVEQGIKAGLEKDGSGNYKNQLILVESMPRGTKKPPLSDEKQHIYDDELYDMITEIAKERAIIGKSK